MALQTRNRVNPPAAGSFHRILAIFGLGSGNNADAEAVAIVADRMKFGEAGHRLLTNAGTSDAYAESAWLPCADRALARFKVEYRGAGTRQFIIAFKAHDVAAHVIYGRIVEPENPGLSGGATGEEDADVVEAGNFVGVGGGLDNVDVRGMAAVKLICLAAVGPAVDAWGAVG